MIDAEIIKHYTTMRGYSFAPKVVPYPGPFRWMQLPGKVLNFRAAAKFCRMTKTELEAQCRQIGVGPIYIRKGRQNRVFYRLSDIEKVKKQTSNL